MKSIVITDEVYTELLEEAVRSGKSVSGIVSDAVHELHEKHECEPFESAPANTMIDPAAYSNVPPPIWWTCS